MKTINELLKIEIIPTLTDFLHDQLVFWEACEKNKNFGSPIKNVLELGVYRLPGEPNNNYPGQSTKTLMILNHFYEFNNFISLDIDDCSGTINNCKKWVRQYGIEVKNHKFVQSNSVHFDAKSEFLNGIDLIFLDTNHDDNYPERIGFKNAGGAGMTYKEICHYAPHLSENGRLFLHDTKAHYVEKELGKNTDGAITKFLLENEEFGFFEHNTNIHGLGQIYRKNSLVSQHL